MQDRTGACLGRMRINIGQPRLDIGDAVGVGGGFGLGQEARPLGIRRQYEIDDGNRSAGRFLLHTAHAHARLDTDIAALRRGFSAYQPEQGGFAGAIAPDKAHLRLCRQEERCLIEQDAPFNTVGEVVDVQHEAPRSTACWQVKAPL